MIERSRNLHEQGLAVVAGYSALLPPVMLFCSRHQSVRDFQIKDQQVKWAQPIQNAYRSVIDGWATDRAQNSSLVFASHVVKFGQSKRFFSDESASNARIDG